VKSVFGWELVRRRISAERASYMGGPDFWVIWRCGAIPTTVGRGPDRSGRMARDKKPCFGLSVGGTSGGSRGLRRDTRRRMQIRRYPAGVEGVPPGPRARKAW
jgi:hypothetical protein